jgi:thioredoxin-like negative regulator of GroEL
METLVKKGEIRLAEIEYGANIELCKSLGVKKLPTIFFYSQGQKVDGFACGPKKVPMLLEKLEAYGSMTLEELAFEAEMFQGNELSQQVMDSLTTTNVPSATTLQQAKSAANKSPENETETEQAKRKKLFGLF